MTSWNYHPPHLRSKLVWGDWDMFEDSLNHNLWRLVGRLWEIQNPHHDQNWPVSPLVELNISAPVEHLKLPHVHTRSYIQSFTHKKMFVSVFVDVFLSFLKSLGRRSPNHRVQLKRCEWHCWSCHGCGARQRFVRPKIGVADVSVQETGWWRTSKTRRTEDMNQKSWIVLKILAFIDGTICKNNYYQLNRVDFSNLPWFYITVYSTTLLILTIFYIFFGLFPGRLYSISKAAPLFVPDKSPQSLKTGPPVVLAVHGGAWSIPEEKKAPFQSFQERTDMILWGSLNHGLVGIP